MGQKFMTIMAVTVPVIPAAPIVGPSDPVDVGGFAALVELALGSGADPDAAANLAAELASPAPSAGGEEPAGPVAADDADDSAVAAPIAAVTVVVPPVVVPTVGMPAAISSANTATSAMTVATVPDTTVPNTTVTAATGDTGGATPEVDAKRPAAALAIAADTADTVHRGPVAAPVGPDAPPDPSPVPPGQPGSGSPTSRDSSRTAAPLDNTIHSTPDAVPPNNAVITTVNPVPAVVSGAGSATAEAVPQQVFPEVVKAFSSGTGTRRLTLQLHPEQLGQVRVVLTVHQGTVRVSLSGSSEAELTMRHGTPELQRLLERAGAHDARIVVGDVATSLSTTGGASAEHGGRGPDWYREGGDGRGGASGQPSGYTRGRADPATGSLASARPAGPHTTTRSAGVDLTI